MEVGSFLIMDKNIYAFMQNTVTNFTKAIQEDNAELTWAIIKNLKDVVSSYEIAAHAETNNQLQEGK